MTCNGATGPVGARGTTEHGSDHPWRGEAHGHHVHSWAMSATPIETGVLPTGHPYARIGVGSRVAIFMPGLSFTSEPSKPATVGRLWKSWLQPIKRHDLTFFEVGRRGDLPPGSTAEAIADDYAAVIRENWGKPVGVMGTSTGGGYAQWLAIRHPDLVDRLVLGYTGHRIAPRALVEQRQAVEHFLAGRWRAGYAIFGAWFMPNHRRLAGAAFWALGPYVMGRPRDLRVLRLDADSDDGFDASGRIGEIRAPTLVVSGGRDAAYPPDLTRELVAGIPGARHIEYPKAGHGGPAPTFPEDACSFLAGG